MTHRQPDAGCTLTRGGDPLVRLRVAFGVVYLLFGGIKFVPGLSPAESLALDTVHCLTLGAVPRLVPAVVALYGVAVLECLIGVLLLTGRALQLAVTALLAHLAGVLSPLVVLPARVFAGPHHLPTLEGQYVIKDLILLAAGLVLVQGASIADRTHAHRSG